MATITTTVMLGDAPGGYQVTSPRGRNETVGHMSHNHLKATSTTHPTLPKSIIMSWKTSIINDSLGSALLTLLLHESHLKIPKTELDIYCLLQVDMLPPKPIYFPFCSFYFLLASTVKKTFNIANKALSCKKAWTR